MSPLPERMADHWWWRTGCRPGRSQYVWHILFGDQPALRELAHDVQARLAGLPGLDLVPGPWLHLTTHIVGFADEITRSDVEEIVALTAVGLRDVRPVTVTFGKTLISAEGVVLAPEPRDPLMPIRAAVCHAAAQILGADRGCGDEWIPHVTTAYSNADGPAQPVIQAVGKNGGSCEVTVTEVHLVAQERAGHLYRWKPVATARLGQKAVP